MPKLTGQVAVPGSCPVWMQATPFHIASVQGQKCGELQAACVSTSNARCLLSKV